MQCPKCQLSNREGIKFFEECGVDGWVEKYEKELASL